MRLPLSLDTRSDDHLYRQLYNQLRELILSGGILPGSRLPPSRALARQLGVGRVTVVTAYDQLISEGFLETRVGAGTFVVDVMPVQEQQGESEPSFKPRLSRWGQRVVTIPGPAQSTVPTADGTQRGVIDFGFGRSFPHIFPYDVWRRLLARYLSTDDTMLSRYGSIAGFDPLREAVADYLRRQRGVVCRSEQVIIVSGTHQALDILSRLLLSAGDEVLVETPGYADAFELFRTFGAVLTSLPVDDEGFPVEQIPANSKARIVFVTPSNQFPRGGAMPLARRLMLLQWAREANALIFEDDYDSELRYDGHPLAVLQGLDREGRVVYFGTFSKVLFPALRLGYAVLPPPLLEPFLKAMELIDRGAPTLTQAAVADFITEGHFERHLRRLRKEYGERRRTLVETLDALLKGRVRYSRDEAGLHVMLLMEPMCNEEQLIREAARAGVRIYPGSPYHLQKPAPPSVLLGFSGLSSAEIEEGIERLAAAFGRCL